MRTLRGLMSRCRMPAFSQASQCAANTQLVGAAGESAMQFTCQRMKQHKGECI